MNELQSWIDQVGQIGLTGAGGIYRGTFDPAELEAHRLTAQWMQAAGMKVWRDAVGNQWGRVEGTIPDAPAIVTGSHLDSVRNGGNYDGPYGVLGGLMAVREVVRRYGPPKLPLEVVAFTCEESSRFALGLMGSRGVAGLLQRSHLDEVKDENGISVAEAMRSIGMDPDRIGEACRSDIKAYVEMHIEQGRVLESAGLSVGVVQSIVGSKRIQVNVKGQADHAGTTPMLIRKDALVGAAKMIAAIPDIAIREGGVMTVGQISALPGSFNVVPEEVEFLIDCRHPLEEAKLSMLKQGEELCRAVAEQSGLSLQWQALRSGAPPVCFSDQVLALLRESCTTAGLPFLDMDSGAGHDARVMAGHCPTGMLFIPCKDGRSHSPQEFASVEDMMAGVEVLIHFLYKVAYQDLPVVASHGG